MNIEDPKIHKLMLGIKSGTDLETSAHYAGISISQIYEWLEVGKREAEKETAGAKLDAANKFQFELWGKLTMARAESIVRNVATIQTAASNGTWQAAAWWLERAVPTQYGKKTSESKAQLDTKSSKELS